MLPNWFSSPNPLTRRRTTVWLHNWNTLAVSTKPPLNIVRALAADPDFAEASYGLGKLLARGNTLEEAV